MIMTNQIFKAILKGIAVAIVMVFVGLPVWAQNNKGTIVVTVTDPNGAVVSGATVTLTDVKGGSFFTFTTGDDGAYKFSLLPAGSYSLTAEASSFTSSKAETIELADGADRTLNLELQIPEIVVETEVISLPETRIIGVTSGMVMFTEPKEPLVLAAFTNSPMH